MTESRATAPPTHHDYVRRKMPLIGIGTWQMKDENVLGKVIPAGLRAGYRLIDTAQVYGNEGVIGRILEKKLPELGLTREDIFITSKLAPANAGAEKALPAILKSLKELKTDYLDLLLIHWPGSWLQSDDKRNKKLREESWAVMVKLHEEGKLRAIGVSNFEVKHLEELKKVSSVVPAVNQVEFHPHFHENDLLKYCNDNDIHFQAYSSLGSPTYREKLFSDSDIQRLARKYNASINVFLLAWAYSQGISVLPRTSSEEHVVDNYKCTTIKVSREDIDVLLNNKVEYKTCWDPREVV